MKHLPLFKKLFIYLDPKYNLRCGVVPVNVGFRYAVSAIDKDNKSCVLYYGNNINKALFVIPPVAVRTTLSDTKVSFIRSPLNNETTDSWIVRNEEHIYPPGFAADQVVNEWDVRDKSIYSATATKDSLRKYRDSIPEGKFILSSISVPLWDLSILYSRFISEPFVIWKITEKGSILGYVKDCRLQSLCNFWPDYEDLKKEKEKIGNELSLLIRSLTAGENISPVIPYFENEKIALPADFSIQNYNIGKPPQINSVPVQYHEVYACSLHEETHLDFANISDTQKSLTIEKKRRTFLYALKGSFITIIALSLFLALGGLVIFGIQKYTDKRARPLQTYIKQIEDGQHRLDSLKTLFRKKASFLSRESIVTYLLNELQLVFPDGVWTEQIEISETDEKKWKINIIALSYSTALIPQTLSNLEKVEGIGNIRMIYSEQVKIEKTKKRVIKAKIEGNWKNE